MAGPRWFSHFCLILRKCWISLFFKEKMAANVDIFISAYKDFKPVVTNPIYTVMDSRDVRKMYTKPNGLDDRFYSELLMYEYVAKNVELKKYVGFCHYRRYFSFLDDVPNMDEIFEDKGVECILPRPKRWFSDVRAQYSRCHNVEDLDIVGGVVKTLYLQYYGSFDSFIHGRCMFPYNMFIMKSDDFKLYIKFVMDVLDGYVDVVGNEINKRIEDNKEKYLKCYYPNNQPDYQYRIGGYLGERLTNVFVNHYFKKVGTWPVRLTEPKYGLKFA